MLEEIREQIEPFLLKVLEEDKLELVEFNLKPINEFILVQIIADRPLGGIIADECSSVNKQISRYLEENSIIDSPYSIEVSSPGIDRPLTNTKDFNRVVSREVRFYLNEKINDKLEHLGVIVKSLDECVVIKVKEVEIEIPFKTINKAIQEI